MTPEDLAYLYHTLWYRTERRGVLRRHRNGGGSLL